MTDPPTPHVPPIHPPAVSPSVLLHVADKIADVAGIATIGYLAAHHIVDGLLATGAVCALLGINTGLRQLGARRAGMGLGLFGLAFLPLLHPVVRAAGVGAVAAARVHHG